MLDHVRHTFLGQGDATPTQLCTLAILVFLVALVPILVIQPPMTKTRPRSDYHRPRTCWPAVLVWAVLTAAVAVVLRRYA